MNRRSFLASAFAASALLSATSAPAAAWGASPDENPLEGFVDIETGHPYAPEKKSLVLVFMTAQQMYPSCGALVLYADAEIDEVRGGNRNIERVMIMPPLSAQAHPDERRNIVSAQASGFRVVTATLPAVLDVSERLAGRPVFSHESGIITGHSQKAFFYNLNDARGFEFAPDANPFENDLYNGLRALGR